MKKMYILLALTGCLAAQNSFAQPYNAVRNAQFANVSPMQFWTNSTWGTTSSMNGSVSAGNVQNSLAADQALSQNISNVVVTAGVIRIQFDYQGRNCSGCLAANSNSDFYVEFAGTRYLGIRNPIAGSLVATTQNGASVNVTTFAASSIQTVLLDIPWSGAVPASGTLSFIHSVSDGGLNDGWDDNYIDNVFVEGTSPLPVHLKSFTGMSAGRITLLKWTTVLEENFSHFEVEHSMDGIVFNTIGEIVAQKQNGETNYAFDTPNEGFFRLKMVDYDQQEAYSNIIKVSNDHRPPNGAVAIYPNPLNGNNSFTLYVLDESLVHTEASLYNIKGEKIKTFTIAEAVQHIDVGTIANGVYFIRLSNNNIVKLVK